MRALFATVALISLAACNGAPRPMDAVLTSPRYLVLDGAPVATARACVDSAGLAAAHERLDALAGDLFAEAGLARPVAAGDRACQWTLRLSDAAPPFAGEAQAVWDGGAAEPDRFAATSTATSAETAVTTVYAATERGALFGLRTALQYFVAERADGWQKIAPGTLVDHAAFARRGIIEGFYGPTFTADERLELIALAGALRQNTYVYGLKDADPFTHDRWRDAYDDRLGPILARAAAVADRNLVDFVWALSPGWVGGPDQQSHSIHYGSDEDFAQLVAKTEDVRALGVTRFALFLDDVAPDFAWPDDAARFASLADAHAYLVNRWDDYLVATGAPEHLWVVGTKYTSDTSDTLSGADWQDYNRTLAASLHPEIQMFWTGPRVYSTAIAADDLAPIDAVVGRKVLVWDNWPLRPEALSGRAPDLDTRAAGLLSNFVMDNDLWIPRVSVADFEESLGTIADYAWRPESYEPAASLARWRPALAPVLRRLQSR